MELNKEHRAALIDGLLDVREKLSLNRKLRNDEKVEPYLKPALDVENYLLRAQMQIIRDAITSNEIDL